MLLDASSYVATTKLSVVDFYYPDLITVSFYKMFGYPTGLGALVVKKELSKILQKSYFGGGTGIQYY